MSRDKIHVLVERHPGRRSAESLIRFSCDQPDSATAQAKDRTVCPPVHGYRRGHDSRSCCQSSWQQSARDSLDQEMFG
ncbi:hypothetical protein SynBIOSE41_03719 [Synechococcus sp. BIOS-E4-1]|nr:hypothetical protein SynBIOSE41_03719 [Synechococcus sp. BIOS-E4-1]